MLPCCWWTLSFVLWAPACTTQNSQFTESLCPHHFLKRDYIPDRKGHLIPPPPNCNFSWWKVSDSLNVLTPLLPQYPTPWIGTSHGGLWLGHRWTSYFLMQDLFICNMLCLFLITTWTFFSWGDNFKNNGILEEHPKWFYVDPPLVLMQFWQNFHRFNFKRRKCRWKHCHSRTWFGRIDIDLLSIGFATSICNTFTHVIPSKKDYLVLETLPQSCMNDDEKDAKWNTTKSARANSSCFTR